ncbi:unnamed protein product, partial [Gulo gulo]
RGRASLLAEGQSEAGPWTLLSEGHKGSRHQPVSSPGLDLCKYRYTVVQNVSFRARGGSTARGKGTTTPDRLRVYA